MQGHGWKVIAMVWGKTWPLLIWAVAIAISCAPILADEPVTTAGDDPAQKENVALDTETLSYLEFRQAQIRREAEVLDELKAEMLASTEKMDTVRAELSSALKTHDEQTEKRIVDLVEVYERMKQPAQIALHVMGLDTELRFQVLSRLKKKTLSAVMLQLSPSQTAAISERLLTFETSTDGASKSN